MWRVTRQAGQRISAQLSQTSPDTVTAILPKINEKAGGCFVWEPGQGDASAISSQGGMYSQIAGCFLAFVPQDEKDHGEIFEDGFMMRLTDPSWEIIKQALETQRPVSLPAKDGGLGFQLKWIQETYYNNFDGLTYYTKGGFEIYVRKEPQTKTDDNPVEMKEIVLLTGDSQLKNRVKLDQLTNYNNAIRDVVTQHFSNLEPQVEQDLIIQFDLAPEGKSNIRMGIRPGDFDARMQELWGKLNAIPLIEIQNGPIKFHTSFEIWGGIDRDDQRASEQ